MKRLAVVLAILLSGCTGHVGGVGEPCQRDGTCLDNLQCTCKAYVYEWICMPKGERP